MIGQTISHYKILEKIAEGGMGIIYKAEDTRLQRVVALKFPSAQVLRDETQKARFMQEARAAAVLDHPNICTLFEIDESEGKTFISMAYVAGQNLYEKIKSGPLDLHEAIDISIQIAQGLYEAHQRGIVHRDIKSANIMVTSTGQVKIMDFGLAKLAGETTLTRLTRQGAIIGTVDYMSPEQARGEPVDHRVDIWSLGVVIYEMLTGELPFKGCNEQAVIHSVLYEEPKYLSTLRSDIPAALEQTGLKMIQKSPEGRHENMGALIAELESIKCHSVAAPTSYEKSPSIAVLPFVNMSADKEQEYFCDGMAEELINALTHIKDLHVIARTSAFSYKGKDVKVCDIGKELNVETVLEGSVRKAGDRLRITAQLVDTTNGHYLWSERYDRDMGDVFAIQDEITSAIVGKLKPKLLGEEKARLAKGQDVDIEAYQLYLKGRFFWNKRGEANLNKAIGFFEQALERHADYAPAYAGLAMSHAALPVYSPLLSKEAFSKAMEMASRALQIDETIPEGHASLGFIKTWYDWDWAGAEREFELAIEFNPGCAVAHHWYGFTFLFRSQFDEAIKQIEQALELDPISVAINRELGMFCYYAGQHDRGLEASLKTIEMDPHMSYAHWSLGGAYLGKAMYEEALGEFLKERDVVGGAHSWGDPFIGFTYLKLGKPKEAEEVLDRLLEHSQQEYIPPAILACMYIVLGRDDEGFAFLEKAYKEHDQALCWLKVHPLLDRVRSDPRYIALLRKMNLDNPDKSV